MSWLNLGVGAFFNLVKVIPWVMEVRSVEDSSPRLVCVFQFFLYQFSFSSVPVFSCVFFSPFDSFYQWHCQRIPYGRHARRRSNFFCMHNLKYLFYYYFFFWYLVLSKW
ncbi:hypothetical protein PanWU01x14_292970, partial [Parasponia andersonii]